MNNAAKALAGIALLLGLLSSRGFAADRNGEGEFLSNVRQLAFEGLRSGEGYFSPDGKSLIFQSE